MPFAFPNRNDEIAEAIDDHSNKILFFAAASNNNNPEVGFPARLPEVICIYSNKTHTERSTFCRRGKEGETDFSTIGEDVEGAWPLHLNDGKTTKREDGTSCSTPIAAGVAALILEYATQKGRYPVKRARDLKKKFFMERILFQCMTERSTTGVYNLIEPWKPLSTHDGSQARMLPMITNFFLQRRSRRLHPK